MSRSRKKNPYWGVCIVGRGSMKAWKNQRDKKIRALSPEEDIKQHKKLTSEWNSPNDGKMFYDDPKGYRK